MTFARFRMPVPDSANFTPPTPQQVSDLLDTHPARMPSMLLMLWPWAVLFLAAVLAAAVNHPLLAPLPILALAVVIGWMSYRSRAARKLEQEARVVQEQAALRWPIQALRNAWRLLPQLTTAPTLYGSTVAVIGDCLDRLKCYDSAIVVYDHLVDRLPNDSPDAMLLRVRRAIAQLQSDQLLDADDSLRRLRNTAESGQIGQPTAALYRLAMLLQQVHTHHYAEAVDRCRRLLRELRPLGVTAGFGYAMVALAYDKLDGQVQHPDASRRARWWWDKATLLLPAPALVDRFPILAALHHGGGV